MLYNTFKTERKRGKKMETENRNIPVQQPVKKRKYGCLMTAIIFGMFSFSLIYGIFQILKDPDKYNTKTPAKNNENMLADMGVSEDEFKEIENILQSCGIDDVKEFVHDELLNDTHFKGETGYRLATREVDNIIMYLNSNNGVYRINYAGNKLYSKKKVRHSLDEYTFTIDEISEWQFFCQEIVKEVLISPSSAKFPSYTKWGFGKDKGIITVQGYVDAENGFGAKIRNDFQFKIKAKDKTIVSFILNGEEIIQQ